MREEREGENVEGRESKRGGGRKTHKRRTAEREGIKAAFSVQLFLPALNCV